MKSTKLSHLFDHHFHHSLPPFRCRCSALYFCWLLCTFMDPPSIAHPTMQPIHWIHRRWLGQIDSRHDLIINLLSPPLIATTQLNSSHHTTRFQCAIDDGSFAVLCCTSSLNCRQSSDIVNIMGNQFCTPTVILHHPPAYHHQLFTITRS